MAAKKDSLNIKPATERTMIKHLTAHFARGNLHFFIRNI
jgi:hypothetical protein